MTPVAPARGADNACPSRWTLARTGPSTHTMDGTIGSDGLFVTSTAPVNATETSAGLTAADADMGGWEPTVIKESLWVSVGPITGHQFV